jgi:hypothetical protein
MDTTDNQEANKNTNETTPPPIEVAPKKKNNSALTVVIIILAVFIVIGLIGWSLGSFVFTSLYEGFGGGAKENAKEYLEEKYGKSEGFSNGSISGGSSFEVGYEDYSFTSNKSDQPFTVHYDNRKKRFTDNYYIIQFEKEFEKYYYNKYGEALEDVMPYKYTIQAGGFEYGDSYGHPFTDEKFNTFSEALKFVEDNKRERDITVRIIVDYKEIGLTELETLDLTRLKRDISDVVNDEIRDGKIGSEAVYIDDDEIPDSINITYYLNIKMEGSGRTGLCPESLKANTVRPGSYNKDDPDEEIQFCEIEAYKIRNYRK